MNCVQSTGAPAVGSVSDATKPLGVVGIDTCPILASDELGVVLPVALVVSATELTPNELGGTNVAPPLPLTSTTGDVETVSTFPPFPGLSFVFSSKLMVNLFAK